eukprot:UN30730
MSLPPIINGTVTQMSPETKNVFIDITATDLTKAHIVLHTLIAGFSEYCKEKFTVEPVNVVYEDESIKNMVTPTLEQPTFETSVSYVNFNLGTTFNSKTVCSLLRKMALIPEPKGDDKILVTAPITRSDILHEIDIVEDVAIAYGYNKLKRWLPERATIGKQQPLNKLSDQIRQNIAMCGFTEVLTWVLLYKKRKF